MEDVIERAHDVLCALHTDRHAPFASPDEVADAIHYWAKLHGRPLSQDAVDEDTVCGFTTMDSETATTVLTLINYEYPAFLLGGSQ